MNVCEPFCGPDEMWCPGGKDWNHCPMPSSCLPLSKNDNDSCPQFCPVACGPEEMPCQGGLDLANCPMPDFCVPAKTQSIIYQDEECPNICPYKCGPEEMTCPGGVDERGCPMPDFCIPINWHDIPRDDGTEARQSTCPSFCPATCMPDEMVCPGPKDMEGCPMPDMCLPTSFQSKYMAYMAI